jgi:hypothetical protein
MKKLMILLAVVSLLVVSGCTKAYWRPNTSYNEAKEDVMRCHAKTRDAFKAGEISWEKEGKSYRHKCMEEKGYILGNKGEAYPELNIGGKSTSNQPRMGTDTGWDGQKEYELHKEIRFVSSSSPQAIYYHLPSCSKKEELGYRGAAIYLTRDQAEKKGLKPCPICKP